MRMGCGVDTFKRGDRVLALLTWGWVLDQSEYDGQRLLVHLDTGHIQSFHWAECHHKRNVVVLDEQA
jgi:hypothetical protein